MNGILKKDLRVVLTGVMIFISYQVIQIRKVEQKNRETYTGIFRFQCLK